MAEGDICVIQRRRGEPRSPQTCVLCKGMWRLLTSSSECPLPNPPLSLITSYALLVQSHHDVREARESGGGGRSPAVHHLTVRVTEETELAQGRAGPVCRIDHRRTSAARNEHNLL